jgi:hypothetical protein
MEEQMFNQIDGQSKRVSYSGGEFLARKDTLT